MELLIPKQDFNTHYNNVLIKYQIPFEIKNDIIYCQKALRTYLKVHQMVILHFGPKLMTALSAVRKLLDDLLREIYEINAEQKYLIYRLRKSLEEFYKSLPLNNVVINRDADNTFLRHSFSKHVDDPDYPCEAISVKTRRTFSQWKKKFCLDDPKRMLNDYRNFNLNNVSSSKTQISSSNSGGGFTLNLGNLQKKQRVSLLKPKCERDKCLIDLDQNMEIKHEDENTFGNDDEKILPTMTSSDSNTNDIMEVDEKPDLQKIDFIKNHEEPPLISLKPSPAMNIGRMKLLQALNKAKNLKESPLAQPQAATIVKSIPDIKSVQKSPEQQKLFPKFVEVSSSSDDSLDGIHVLTSIEPERPNQVFHINQEMFLRQFGLYTLQHSAYLKQRRSKRRRRNVQMNENKDFHYGTINYAAIEAQTASFPKEKKKKIFLASPTISRKSNKRRKSAKDDISNSKTNNKSDRSLTSSPDEKVFCNVCFRSNKLPTLNCCKKCKQFYHLSCHSKYGIKLGYSSTKKICPICICAKKSSRSASSEGFARSGEALITLSNVGGEHKVRRSSLIDQCHLLKQKIVTAKSRHSSLLKESEIYKTKMNELFNIVGTIKNQQDDLKTKGITNILEIEISDDDETDDNKNKNYESNGIDSIKEKSKNFISASSSSLSSRDSKEESKLIEINKISEIYDSDEDILVIKEDNSIIEIQDGINEENSSEN